MLLNTALAAPAISLSNITAFQLLVAGALLLALAALLLALSRERRVSVKHSTVTEELSVQMARIANALENLADPLRDRSHFTASREPASAPTERAPTEKTPEPAHHIAYSIFGR
jgi:hypothetical protein